MHVQTPTRWFVITGAPCSGKTTVIKVLQQLGYACTPEAARAYIEAQLAKGNTLAHMRRDEGAFQQSLIVAKHEIEKMLDPFQLTFMDRAMPDSISYFKLKGIETTQIARLSEEFRYAGVFLFDRLPLSDDGVRVENEENAAFLDNQLEYDYRALGYNVVRVPAIPVQARVQLVLSQIQLS